MLLLRRLAGGRRFVNLLDERTRALDDRLVLRARGDSFEKLSFRSVRRRLERPLERAHAGILVIGLRRDREELRRVRDPGGRRRGDARILRVPRDAAKQLAVLDLRERGRPHGFVGRRLRDRAELFLIADAVERRDRIRVRVGRGVRDRHELVAQLAPQRLVALRS